MLNLGLGGEDPCVTTLLDFPIFLVSPNLFNVLVLLVGAVIAKWWWVWQDCQSLPTCPLHQRILPLHVAWGKRKHSLTPLPPLLGILALSVHPPHAEPLSVHLPHAEGKFVHLRA